MKLSRRGFIKGAAAVGLTGGFAQVVSSNSKPDNGGKMIIRVYECKGGRDVKPMPKERLSSLYVMDENYDPFHSQVDVVEDGIASAHLPGKPFRIAFRMSVPGFGNTWLYADNNGEGYPVDGSMKEICLNEECAMSRISLVSGRLETERSAGFAPSASFNERLEKARADLRRCKGLNDPAGRAAHATGSLAHSLWAGEMLAVESARARIAKAGPRPDFLLGSNAFGALTQGEDYARRFYDVFNYCTLPVYWRGFEKERGKPDFARLDEFVDWVQAGKITPKGHPLMWFHRAGIPDWLEDKSYTNVSELHQKRIHDLVGRFAGRIDIWDVINEAHDWANILGYSYDQMLELTRLAAEETLKANPKALRVINTTVVWGEYAAPKAGSPPSQTRKHTVHQYVKDVISAGIGFEALGLQVYNPSRDMLEMDRMLERFSKLGKTLHITEQGVPSEATDDEKSNVKKDHSLWHSPWSEKIQADWIEQFWTIAFSKPYVKAITWWDFSDAGGHFWPHGGWLRPDLSPKECYTRMLPIIRKWRGRA